nr:cysteine desulfurase [bacterium]
GWLSHEDALSFLSAPESLLRYDRPIRRTADFPELGTGNTMGYAALEASTAIIEKLGVNNISAHIGKYLDLLELNLKGLGFTSLRGKRGSGILSVIPPPGFAVTDICRALGERGIVCSTPDGLLRFAPHWPNPLGEVPFIELAVREAIGHPGRFGKGPRCLL